MGENERRLKTIVRLDLIFLLIGLAEVFLLVFLTHKLYFMVPGLVTVLAAHRAMKPGKVRWNYFLGIWSMIKYNPVTLGMVFFLLSDMFSPFGGYGAVNLSYGVMVFIAVLTLAIFVFSFVAGIVIMVKTSKYITPAEK